MSVVVMAGHLPATWRRLRPEGDRRGASRMRSVLDLPFSLARPSGVYPGAITIS